jgi:hypothetical protein
MKASNTLAVSLLISLVGAHSALADRRDRITSLVDADVFEVVTEPTTGMRAIVGDDNGAYLAIERIEKGRVVQQAFLRELTFSDGGIMTTPDLRSISVGRWRQGSLDVDVVTETNVSSKCSVAIDFRRSKQGLTAACSGSSGTVVPTPPPVPGGQVCTTKKSGPLGGVEWGKGLANDGNQWTGWFETGVNDIDSTRNASGGQRRVWAYFADHSFEYVLCTRAQTVPQPQPVYVAPPPPPVTTQPAPYKPSIQDVQNATAACKRVHSFSSDVEVCVNQSVAALSGPFPNSAFSTVTACGNAFSFSSDRITCQKIAATSSREPVEVINFCKSNNSFSSDIVTCMQKWAK